MECVVWGKRDAVIRNNEGEVIFRQEGVEAPTSWSDTAVDIVASRYFRGVQGTPERETGINRLIERVVGTIHAWGIDQAYFASEKDAEVFRDELTVLLLKQCASFNSPVWFNVGVEPAPQCSACFILSVDDTMESILEWYKTEGMIFKGGSGSGVNLSRLRSSREPLSGGGTASGPVSFMRAADASAGVIKSGGKTRRAAKMVILEARHPDVVEFIRCKALEEMRARVLSAAGYGSKSSGEGFSSVSFQNSNHAVRVDDAFMEACEKDLDWETHYTLNGLPAAKQKARALLREIAHAAHACGDPGVQFHSVINLWHTCPESGPIRASNPCSEYMSVDDSSCNLASLKLTAFLRGGMFDVDAFVHAVQIMITAQDILVDKASYPTPKIAETTQRLRALGLGYADLGALCMSLGAPYDSDDAREWAAAITGLMTAEAYLQSIRIAQVKGVFADYPKNRDAALRVMNMHRSCAEAVAFRIVPQEIANRMKDAWREVCLKAADHGLRNSQTTVLAPTGTVAFMMDCDTTGIEPEAALVKFKKLAGGGVLRVVNKTVPAALERLGHEKAVIDAIVERIRETGGVEGDEHLRAEHLPVFDCALRPHKGSRVISADGHLKMMAAVQPFLSGAISKTVNLPHHTSVQDVEEVFLKAWRLGLKAVTVYRDGCKADQPLSTDPVDVSKPQFLRPIRRRLPVDCKSYRHKFEIAGQKGYIHTGFYEDGAVGEIFIRMAKEGSTVSGLMDTIATLTSIALQYGVPLEALVNKFSHVRFEPSGFTTNPDIPLAKSLTDYIFRYLGTRFLDDERKRAAGLIPPDMEGGRSEGVSATRSPSRSEESLRDNGHYFDPRSDAPACRDCGAIMIRSGSCYGCPNCGATNGCS
jgi:ribonucleoside-diphosphate reductase alpha chain